MPIGAGCEWEQYVENIHEIAQDRTSQEGVGAVEPSDLCRRPGKVRIGSVVKPIFE